MLVLRRKIGQAIQINDDIRIVIQDVQNEHIVRIGIEAPAEIPVHRLEIYNLIQEENKSAGGAGALDWLKGASNGSDSDGNSDET
ncbi:carbon storage regulator [Mariprofundus micogutta]|uniref:Translational regulator CsrA n=1 Tax=Mariprofundus micogutta TaxID=1921010 RepID=A0A1L8CKJ9_9PROT|nr:carbon storage regulator CsrA [Mariprofundus micogutta]GAV19436.1 carbon storage regulator [Mariprofundus micogutta]